MTLDELAIQHGTDKSSQGHGYTLWYAHYLYAYRNRPITLLEIGAASGASLRMWRDWMPHASVYGIDHNPACAGEGVFIGDAKDPVFLARVLDTIQSPDLVIDDGGHKASEQIAAFRALFPAVAPGGMYVVEDTHAWYSEGYVDAHPTAKEFFTSLVDHVNVNGRGLTGNFAQAVAFTWGLPMPEYAALIESIHVHQSMLFLRRRA